MVEAFHIVGEQRRAGVHREAVKFQLGATCLPRKTFERDRLADSRRRSCRGGRKFDDAPISTVACLGHLGPYSWWRAVKWGGAGGSHAEDVLLGTTRADDGFRGEHSYRRRLARIVRWHSRFIACGSAWRRRGVDTAVPRSDEGGWIPARQFRCCWCAGARRRCGGLPDRAWCGLTARAQPRARPAQEITGTTDVRIAIRPNSGLSDSIVPPAVCALPSSVERTGIEPVTSGLQSRRSPS